MIERNVSSSNARMIGTRTAIRHFRHFRCASRTTATNAPTATMEGASASLEKNFVREFIDAVRWFETMLTTRSSQCMTLEFFLGPTIKRPTL